MATPHTKDHTDHAAAHQDETSHEEAHHGGTKLYWIIGVILAVITITEVIWPSVGLDDYAVVTGLMVMMFFKGAMVVMFFMHLKGDPNIFKFVFIAPFLIAVSFVMSFIVLLTLGHVGIAG